jgi:two-component system, OmpR family, sensor kinase
MKTGSLRARVILTTLALLAIVLASVVTAVTLAYRAKLDGDLHSRLAKAGAAVERAGSAGAAKRLLPGLALEGIAIRIKPPPATGATATARTKTGSTIQTHGSLLVLEDVLPDRTQVSFSASRASIDRAVTSLLLVELVVAGSALALATFLVLHGTRTALSPLSAVIETATRIAHGDSKLRLKPSRTNTELGSSPKPSTRCSTPSKRPSRKHARATLQPAASSPTPRTNCAPRSPPSKRASKPSCANNPNGLSATASRQPSRATANESAAS